MFEALMSVRKFVCGLVAPKCSNFISMLIILGWYEL